jgi:pyridoxamine 5'-phosphate oxidase
VPLPPRPLLEDDLDPDPLTQLRRWYDDAADHGQLQPDAMVLATSTPDGRPSARMVLLRGVDVRGLCFYTDLESRKGQELAANPSAAIAFHWPEVLRQVRATGRVERVDDEQSDAYWQSRPHLSRVSAWASDQSKPVSSRADLDERIDAAQRRFTARDVPRPSNWGGYRFLPDEVEFWQHRDDRAHDRIVYTRSGDDAPWELTRLQP